MAQPIRLSVLIPLYNEEQSVPEIIRRLLALEPIDGVSDLEIVVVDDCSTDSSYAVVQTLAELYPTKVRVFRHSVNKGKGAGIHTALREAKGDTILIQDADLELFPEDVPEMVKAMHATGAAFVNGSRYLPGVYRTAFAFWRYFFNKFFTLLVSLAIDVRLTDVACGYKMIRKSFIDRITLREMRFGFEVELIIKAARLQKNLIVEVPVRYAPRNLGQGKKLRTSDGFRVLGSIVRYGFIRLN